MENTSTWGWSAWNDDLSCDLKVEATTNALTFSDGTRKVNASASAVSRRTASGRAHLHVIRSVERPYRHQRFVRPCQTREARVCSLSVIAGRRTHTLGQWLQQIH